MTTITLSSRLTIFYKFIFTPVWIGGFGAGTIAMFVGNSPSPESAIKLTFFVGWFLGAICLLWSCVPLKRVRIDSGALRISNYLKEIAVPAGLIDSVTESRWINIHPVTIHFRADTEFGRKIVFMPKSRFAFGWTSHPVVGEIERLAQAAAGGVS